MNTRQVGLSPTMIFHHQSEVDAVKQLFNGILPSGEISWYDVADDYYNSLYDTAYISNKVELDIDNGRIRVKDI